MFPRAVTRLRGLLARNALLQKGLLTTLAILSALALKPGASVPSGPKAAATEPPSSPLGILPRFAPASALILSEPGLPSALNTLLYLEDFGSNLYSVDSLTGATRLAPTPSAALSAAPASASATFTGTRSAAAPRLHRFWLPPPTPLARRTLDLHTTCHPLSVSTHTALP